MKKAFIEMCRWFVKSKAIKPDKFYRYETIQLRQYLKIASTGDLLAVAINRDAELEECYDAWEEIIKKNSAAGESQTFNMYMSTYQAFGMLLADYNIVNAYLTVLLFEVDNEGIDYLREKGYPIDTTSSLKYKESIEAAAQKARNIYSKILSKHSELDSMFDKETATNTDSSELVASLSFMLGFSIEDNILLAKYNQYQKVLRVKNKLANKKGKEY